MDVYIKPVKKFKAEGKRDICLKDIAQVHIPGTSGEKFKNLILLTIDDKKRCNYLVTIMDIVKSVSNLDSKATIVNMGETDTVIEFYPQPPKNSSFVTWLKVVSISVILFFGAATAIMSFHSDGEIPDIMKGYYSIFYGEEKENPYILEVPYSIGLALGIIIFYNHFSKLKMSCDPTPIEVQMTIYGEEVLKNQLETLENKKEK